MMQTAVILYCLLLTLVLTTAAMPTSQPQRLIERNTEYWGTGTYYDVGPGSCGENDTNDEMVVAVSMPQMQNGANPNTNVHCNKMVSIQGQNGHCQARIVDTCRSCQEGSLDMSPAVFETVCGPLADGKCDIHWEFL